MPFEALVGGVEQVVEGDAADAVVFGQACHGGEAVRKAQR